jgi:OmpA-OmpF porin, OOP family
MPTRFKLLLSMIGYALTCAYALSRPRAGEVSTPMALHAAIPACTQSPSLSLRLEGGRPVISGSLPDVSAREVVHARAVSLFGSDGFDDHLTVSSAARQAPWVALAPSLLGLFRRLGGDASLAVRERTLVVAGLVSSDVERAMLLQTMRASVPGDVELVDHLTVAQIPVAAAAPLPAMVAPVPVAAPVVPAAAPVIAAPPPPPPGSLQASLDGALAGYPFEFVSGTDTLTRANDAHLDAVAVVIRQWPTALVAIEGHTDNAGDLGITRDVAARHAAAVARGLMTRGVLRRQVRVFSAGADHPIADNGTVEGRARNWRVALRVLSEGATP